MARNDNEISEQIDNNEDLQRSMERGGVETGKKKPEKQEPVYSIVNDVEKIPVSRHHGKIFKSRIDRGKEKRRKRYESKWEEALKYYNADQSSHRTQDGGDHAQNIDVSEATKVTNSQTENIVFANTSALVPAIYAKNPDVEITESLLENEEYAEVAERFINNMLKRKAFPRFNIRDAMRRGITCTTITNVSYIEIGYTRRTDASQAAYDELQTLSTALAEAKSQKEIEDLEGRIAAIEDKIAFLRPEGPWHKYLSPMQVVRDPTNTEESIENDAWIAIFEYMPTNYLQAVYGTKKNGEQRMIFKPSHVLPANKDDGGGHEGRNAAEVEIDSYELLSKDSSATDFGYDNEEAYKDAKMTKVWRIWDKTTRRLYMYADNDWTWPIWVWNDPYNLIDFYPIHQLTFYTNPVDGIGGSEVSYYLDQQDELNEINSELRNARRSAKFNLAYDKNKVNQNEVEAMLDSRQPRALGVDVPDGMKIGEMIEALMPASMKYGELFDKSRAYDAIHRISSVTSAMQGNEFRTNTTNKAIEFYNSTQSTRLDEKIDAIENFIAATCWTMFQMCVQFMSREVVEQVIGKAYIDQWHTMSARELQEKIGGMQVVGGSTQKPNTIAKQRMAIEVGQTLGQFAQAAPQAVLVMLRVMERAFDDIVISKEDWEFLKQTVGAAVGANEEQITTSKSEIGGETGPSVDAGQMTQIIDGLPLPAKEALARAILQGVPIEQALQGVMQALQGAQQQAGQQGNRMGQPSPSAQPQGAPQQQQQQPQPQQRPQQQPVRSN